jgi:hypothetical protein
MFKGGHKPATVLHWGCDISGIGYWVSAPQHLFGDSRVLPKGFWARLQNFEMGLLA